MSFKPSPTAALALILALNSSSFVLANTEDPNNQNNENTFRAAIGSLAAALLVVIFIGICCRKLICRDTTSETISQAPTLHTETVAQGDENQPLMQSFFATVGRVVTTQNDDSNNPPIIIRPPEGYTGNKQIQNNV